MLAFLSLGQASAQAAKRRIIPEKRVLFILSSDFHGYWGEELAAPVAVLRSAGVATEFASPAGKAEIEPMSVPAPYIPHQWTSPEMARQMAREVPQLHAEVSSGTLMLSEVRGSSYDAVVVVGGHGAMFDIDRNAEVHRILRQANDAGKIVAAECHGTGALAFADLIRGKRITGFPDELESDELRPELPFVLQDELIKASGGKYENSYRPNEAPRSLVIVADNVITACGPMSSAALGQALLGKLKP